jgi:hypothetical protein
MAEGLSIPAFRAQWVVRPGRQSRLTTRAERRVVSNGLRAGLNGQNRPPVAGFSSRRYRAWRGGRVDDDDLKWLVRSCRAGEGFGPLDESQPLGTDCRGSQNQNGLNYFWKFKTPAPPVRAAWLELHGRVLSAGSPSAEAYPLEPGISGLQQKNEYLRP